MADSFTNVYSPLRTMEATINSVIDHEPFFDKDVPPTATIWSPSKLTIVFDATGPFANPFAAAAAEVDATPSMEQKVPSLLFTEKNMVCPETWSQGKFQIV